MRQNDQKLEYYEKKYIFKYIYINSIRFYYGNTIYWFQTRTGDAE